MSTYMFQAYCAAVTNGATSDAQGLFDLIDFKAIEDHAKVWTTVVKHGNLDNLEKLLSANVPMTYCSFAVSTATELGNLAMVKRFHEHGVDCNVDRCKEIRFQFPILDATRLGHIEIVKFLVNVVGVQITPDDLMQAVRYGHVSIYEFFVSCGADTSCKTAQGYSAMFVAVLNCRVGMSVYLVEHGSDITELDNDGNDIFYHIKRSWTPGFESSVIEIFKKIRDQKVAELKIQQEQRDAELKIQQEQCDRDAELKIQQEQRDAELKIQQEQRDAELKIQQEQRDAELKAQQDASMNSLATIIVDRLALLISGGALHQGSAVPVPKMFGSSDGVVEVMLIQIGSVPHLFYKNQETGQLTELVPK